MNDVRAAGILEALKDQLRRAMEGPAWHGPSVGEGLEGITAAEAAQHPVAGAHGCWELVLHLSGSYHLVLRRLDGVAAPFLPYQDWPPRPPLAEGNWQRDMTPLYALNARGQHA